MGSELRLTVARGLRSSSGTQVGRQAVTSEGGDGSDGHLVIVFQESRAANHFPDLCLQSQMSVPTWTFQSRQLVQQAK